MLRHGELSGELSAASHGPGAFVKEVSLKLCGGGSKIMGSHFGW